MCVHRDLDGVSDYRGQRNHGGRSMTSESVGADGRTDAFKLNSTVAAVCEDTSGVCGYNFKSRIQDIIKQK